MNQKVKGVAKGVEWQKRPLVQPLYSSLIVADGALGEQVLFTSPLGQPIPAIGGKNVPGSLINRYHDERTTSMNKAGCSSEDALLQGLSYDFPEGCPIEHQRLLEQVLTVKVKIGGMVLFTAPVIELPVLFTPPIPLGRTDDIRLVIDVGSAVPLKMVRRVNHVTEIPAPIQPQWRRFLWDLLGIPAPRPSVRYDQEEIPEAVLVRFTFDAVVTPDPR